MFVGESATGEQRREEVADLNMYGRQDFPSDYKGQSGVIPEVEEEEEQGKTLLGSGHASTNQSTVVSAKCLSGKTPAQSTQPRQTATPAAAVAAMAAFLGGEVKMKCLLLVSIQHLRRKMQKVTTTRRCTRGYYTVVCSAPSFPSGFIMH